MNVASESTVDNTTVVVPTAKALITNWPSTTETVATASLDEVAVNTLVPFAGVTIKSNFNSVSGFRMT